MADRDRSPGSAPHAPSSRRAAASPAPTTRRSLVSSLHTVGDRLRARLYLGIPWGTLVLCVLLVAVYAIVQGGAAIWSRPVVVPFTSWSYHHPLGVLVGPLAHQGPSHLLENLAGVLVFGSAAEFLIGHFPNGEREPDALGRSPLARALVGFPALAVLAGVLTSAFSWGPTIGFSNVVFVFAGIVLVSYPLGAVVALVAMEALVLVVRAMTQPFVVAGRAPPTDPWFVDTAVQSHTFGLLCGVAVGAWLLGRREDVSASSLRLWTGTAVFALGGSLWVLWWPEGGGYVLGRAPGVVFVAVLATIITVGTVVATRGLPTLPLDRGPVSDRERRSEPGGTGRGEARGRQVGFAVLVVPLAIAAGIAIPLNASATATVPAGAEPVDVRGYTVTYAEDVPNQRLAPFASVTGDRPTTSGVLVVHPARGIWTRVVSARALARDGTATIRLGGLGWDRRVFAVRRAWRTTGGEVAAGVWINPADGGFHRVYASSPARAAAVLDGYTVAILPGDLGFRLRVRRDNRTVGILAMPDRGENETVGHLTLRRSADRLVAVVNRTRVPLANHD